MLMKPAFGLSRSWIRRIMAETTRAIA
jgi:hypothetical protein